jgi:hypothetical protein
MTFENKRDLVRKTETSVNKLADNMTTRRKIISLLAFSPNAFKSTLQIEDS